MKWYLTEEGVLCNLDRMTHIMPAKTEFKDQEAGDHPWQVVAMFPVGGMQQPQMHIPLKKCATKEECMEEIAKLQDEIRTSMH